MQDFCQSLGVTCSNIVVSQKILNDDDDIKTVTIKAFQIDWMSDHHLVYPIEPRSIPQREDPSKAMHSLYEKQILCDLSLIANDGALKVHSLPLFFYGGDVMQGMLTSSMKESLEKTIYFNDFSLSSVQAFIDFIYLGEKGLEPASFAKRDVDLYELFKMAHLYQVQPLIDCCTNLLSLFSTPADVVKIKALADLYQNDHLAKLHAHLMFKIASQESGYIKV